MNNKEKIVLMEKYLLNTAPNSVAMQEILQDLRKIESGEMAEVVKCEWNTDGEEDSVHWVCSRCGYESWLDWEGSVLEDIKYCWNCGAKLSNAK
jgi:predicted RNA-binding Zn-ribbon protein involved in translation (DUF1610 family)